MFNQGKIRQKAFFLKFFSIQTKKVLKSLFVFFILTGFAVICLRLSNAYPFIPAVNYDVVNDPRQAAAADFDGDTDLDLAVVNYRTSNVSILKNNGDNTFASAKNYDSDGAGSRALAARDFDGINGPDLAIVNFASNEIAILLNDGTGDFSAGASNIYDTVISGNISSIAAGSPPVVTTIVPHGFKLGDQIGPLIISGTGNLSVPDGRYAIKITGIDTFTIYDIEVTDPSGAAGTFETIPNPSAIVSEDFNNDTFYDLAVTNTRSNNLSVFLGNGDGTFDPPVHYNCNGYPGYLISADFNNDTALDLVVTNNGQGGNGFTVLKGNLVLGSPDGTFGTASSIFMIPNPDGVRAISAIAAGYFNNTDTNLDIAAIVYNHNFKVTVPGYESNIKIYTGDGSGGFTPVNPPIGYSVGHFATSIVAADFNADTKTDLAVTNFVNNTVSILTGNYDAGATFNAAVNYSVGDGPISLLNADIDGDLKADLITVNKGENNITFNDKSNSQISYLRNNGVIITESDNSTQVKEDALPGDYGETDTYTVVLSSAPSAAVTVTITTDGQTTTNPTPSLTFTPDPGGNWSTPQTVTVTASSDGAAEGPHFGIITHVATSADGNFNLKPIPSVNVSIIDDDKSGISLYQSGGRTEVTENGTTDTYNVVLNKQPAADVVISISAVQVTAVPASLTFTSGNWKNPQTVTLTAINDFWVEGSQQISVSHNTTSSDLLYNGLNVNLDGVNVLDDNVAYANPLCSGIMGDLNNDFRINAIDINLETFLIASVMPYNACGKLDGQSLFIGPGDISLQTNIAFMTGDYSKEVVVFEKPYGTGTYVTEGGTNDFFQMFLQQSPAPGKKVVVDISFDSSKVVLDKSQLTFLPGNYYDGSSVSGHEVTIDAYDDFIEEGPHTDTITFAINPVLTTDTNYLVVPLIPSITVNIKDNDTAGINIVVNDNITDESGDTGNFSIVLNSQPTTGNTVNISLTSSDPLEGILSTDPLNVVFDEFNWDSIQTIFVTGVDDGIVSDGNINYTIDTIPAVSADPNYNGLNPDDISMWNQDNDPPGIIILPFTGSAQTTEAGGTFTFQFVLLSDPINDVTVSLDTSDHSEGRLSTYPLPLVVTFTTLDWADPHTVTVTGVDDTEDDGDILYALNTTNSVSANPLYNNLAVADPSITNLDDDTVGFTVSAISNNTTESIGVNHTATFTVVLDTAPTDDVYIGISSSDITEGSVLPTSLTFTVLDWNIPQTVTVTGVDDDEADGDISYTIETDFAVSTDTNYNGQNPADVAVINQDDDSSFPPCCSYSLYTPILTCEAIDLTVNNAVIKAINWKITDNNNNEIGFSLYGTSFIRKIESPDVTQIQEPDVNQNPIAGLLEVNTPYTRFVRVYDNNVSADSNQKICYTLANKPKPVILSKITANSINVNLAPNDGNPSETLYAIRVISGSAPNQTINYVDTQGNFSSTPRWHTYGEFGGASGVVVTGGQSVTGALVQMALTSGENYCFEAQAKNGDGVVTDPSDSNCSGSPITPPPATESNIEATKGVGINLPVAWYNAFGLFATAWAGDNFVIDASGPISRILGVFSWLLNIVLLILLVILGLSLFKTLKHLKHEYKYPDTLKLIWGIISEEAPYSYKEHAPQTVEGVYHQSAYAEHKKLHNLAQGTFLGSMIAVGIKIIILGALLSGLIQLNHSSLAQSALYNRSGATVYAGDVLSYIIEVTNNITATPSDTDISNATVTDNIDPNLENFTVTGLDNCGSYTDSSTAAALNITGIDVAVGTTCFIRFTAEVKASSAGTITNQAQVLANGDTIPTNTTSNPIGAQVPTNANQNINQARCGNKIIDPGEACDYYDCANGQPCTSSCQCEQPINGNINQPPAAVCGNDVIELPGEACDGLGCDEGYECNTNCQCERIAPINGNINQPIIQPFCGNNIIEEGEECDLSDCAVNQQCVNCACETIIPTNGNQNINQPPQPPTNGNINQPPILPPAAVQPSQIPIFGSIIDVFDNPNVEQTSQNIVTPILITVAALNTLPAIIILTLYLLPWLHLLFLEPLLAFFRRKRKKWGIVYNSLTKLPVDLALVRLYNQSTNQLVQTKVTDREGRYIIIAKEPGKYYLTVTKPGFLSPSSYLRGETQDTKYIDLYHGEVIEVTEKDAVLTANIPLDPAEKKALNFTEIIRSYALKNIRLIVSYLGLILALIVVLIIPTVFTIGALIIHGILFLAFRRFINPPKPKSWGIIYDQITKAPLKQTVVRIFDTKFNKLLETQVTDSKGRYSFLVGQNEYQMLMGKPGYQTKEVSPVDLVKNEEIINLDVGLDKS